MRIGSRTRWTLAPISKNFPGTLPIRLNRDSEGIDGICLGLLDLLLVLDRQIHAAVSCGVGPMTVAAAVVEVFCDGGSGGGAMTSVSCILLVIIYKAAHEIQLDKFNFYYSNV